MDKVDSANIVIKHYRYKTLEEYLIRQYKRHWGTSKHHTSKVQTLDKLLINFFKYNDRTPEKTAVISSLKKIALFSKIVINIYFKNDK